MVRNGRIGTSHSGSALSVSGVCLGSVVGGFGDEDDLDVVAVEAEFLLGADGEGVTDWPVPWRAARAARWRGAEAAVVGLGAGNGVFYVGLVSALEPCTGVGSINAALSRDDLWMN